MTLAIVYSRANVGIDAPLVTVETHVSGGLPRFNIVGLPAAAVRESRDRVRSALMNAGFDFPSRRITVNLAPADLPKEGGRFDLPIALGILVATGQIPADKFQDHEFVGELALSGELRAIRGVLPVVLTVQQANRYLIVPESNAHEAGMARYPCIFYAEHLLDVCAYLKEEKSLPHCRAQEFSHAAKCNLDFSDVRGQHHAKRALAIAAAGQHNILFIGPPGSGKTMLANRLPSLLPKLNDEQARDIAAISSLSHTGFIAEQWGQLPFRSPHHGSSSVALIGGGRPPRPGEISLSHHGVLFLDELPEFAREVLESLREPLESGQIKISRAGYQVAFPAQFQLIAAMNPCPCGFLGSVHRECVCSQEQVQRYMNKLSGPLLDRIDLQVAVSGLSPEILSMEVDNQDESVVLKKKIFSARQYQIERQGKCNKELGVKELDTFCSLDKASQDLLKHVTQKFNLSARAYHKIIKVARTIADLSESNRVESEHIGESLTYRCLDKARLIMQ